MIRFLKRAFFPLLIILISVILFLTNYKPGTFLIGWDNLFPEFNFKINLQRDLFAVWQQYRGLGALDNFAHASNLFHDIYRWVLSFFLPVHLIRWVFVFLMHFFGGLGMMRLLRRFAPRNDIIVFIGTLFYMFNLGTIQQFFLPLEAFVIHFAFLPWLFLAALNLFENGSKKSLLLLFLISLLATPQAFIPTLFSVYFFGIFIFFLTKVVLAHLTRESLIRFFILLAVIIVTNIFWLLPAGYSFLTYSKTVANAKNYQMASNDIYYRNKKYGDFSSVTLIKGVSLDFKQLDYKTGSSHFMMWPWLNHLESPLFIIPAWIFFILAVLGFFHSIKTKNKTYLPFSTLFAFSFIMMGTDIPVVSWLVDFLRQYIPLFATIFRFTFTKFSILYAFSYSILLAFGLNTIMSLRAKRSNLNEIASSSSTPRDDNVFLRSVFCVLCSMFIILYSLPSFTGHFFYENLAVKIPDEYFQVFDFFQNQNHNERVAILPIPWYWAWLQPKWGTINSGFIWYGIPQPITDLAFTPWGRENENFYWELDRAIYAKDSFLLRKVLEKYDITWIYLDKNIVNNTGEKITFEDYKQLLSETSGVHLATRFNLISIYRIDNNKLDNFVTIKSNLKSVSPQYQYNDNDQAYIDYGDYLSDKNPEVYYPFRSLFSGKNPKDIEFIVNEDAHYLYFESTLPDEVLNWNIKQSNPFDQEFTVYDKENKPKKYQAQISVNKNVLTVAIDKKIVQVYRSKNDQVFSNQENNACEKNSVGKALLQKSEEGLILTSIGSHNCIKIDFPQINQRYGYLFNVKTKNDDKRGLFIDVTNLTSKKNDLETYTDNDGKDHSYYLVSSPRSYYDLGYTLYFNNISEGREKIINTLKEVNAYQIPYYFLKNLKLIKPWSAIKNIKPVPSGSFTAKQINILYLSQSFSPGWKAWMNGKELKDHVLINNWANGWKLDRETCNVERGTCKITIVFWPQYLEFAGFGLLIGAFIFILLYRPKIKVDDKNN